MGPLETHVTTVIRGLTVAAIIYAAHTIHSLEMQVAQLTWEMQQLKVRINETQQTKPRPNA